MKTRLLTILALALVVNVLAGQAPLTARWALDETTGTTAADSSVNGNHGTLVGFAGSGWVPGILGNALSFNGTTDYVNCMTSGGLPVHGSGAYSITGWVNAPPQNDRRIYSEGSSVSNTPLFTLGSGVSQQGSLRVYIRNDAGAATPGVQTTATVFDSTWHHFAWVTDGNGGGQVYVDGVLDATSFDYNAVGTFTTDLVSLGAVLRAAPSHWMTGTLDDVRVYPFAITANDVSTIIGGGTLGTGFQTNQGGASLDVDGSASSVASPARVTVAQGGTFTLNLATQAGGFPWELATDTTPGIPNAVPVGPGNVLNISLATATLANGFFATSWGTPLSLPGFPATGYALSTSLSYTAPAATFFLTMQFAMIDPAAPTGVSLSGAAEVDVP